MIERLRNSVRGPNHKWWALGTVGLGTFMSTLDSSIVNVSLPSILTDFDSDLATIEWVVLAYLLTITATLLTFGRLADIAGRKRVYTIGFGVFTFGSLCCGLAASPLQLILARVVQAVGGAMIQANGLAITGAVFPKEERGRALGINGTVVATGIAAGPAIGGLLVNAFGWPSIFLVNLPVGTIGIGLSLLVLEERRISFPPGGNRAGQRFDPAGAFLISVALVTLLLGLNQGHERGWGSWPIAALLVAAAVSFAAFLAVERQVAAPLIDLGLFRVRAFAAGSLAALLSFLAVSTNAFLMPFYLQLVLGYDPARAGLLLTPTPLTLAVVAPLSGWLSDRFFGAQILSSIGLGVTCLALALLGGLAADAHYADVLVRLILLGVGLGLFNSPNTSSIFGAVPRERYGTAGGFVSMMRNSGQVVGVALAGAVLLAALAPAVGAIGLDALRPGGAPGAERGPLVEAFMTGQRRAYFAAAALAATGVVVSLSRGRRAPVGQTSAATPTPAPARDVAD